MSLEEITVLKNGLEAIRKRPAMYVKLDASAPSFLISEALCTARAAVLKGLVSKVDIEIHHGFLITDNGPGWDLSIHDGRTIAELHLTVLHACRAANDPNNIGFCGVGMAVLVALCRTFRFETYTKDQFWTATFHKGELLTANLPQPSTNHSPGTQMYIELDDSILPVTDVKLEDFDQLKIDAAKDGLTVRVEHA